MTPSASAFCCASAPASVIGHIAPASVNGVTITGWPYSAISIRPSAIGPSTRSGELVLTTVLTLGSDFSCSRSTPRAIAAMRMPSPTRPPPRQYSENARSDKV